MFFSLRPMRLCGDNPKCGCGFAALGVMHLLLVAEHFLKGRVIRFAGHVALPKTRSLYIPLAPVFIALLTAFRLNIGLLHVI